MEDDDERSYSRMRGSYKKGFLSPSNLQFFISGADLPAGEYFGEDVGIVSNGRVVTIPCQYEMEGDTVLIIGQLDEVPKEWCLHLKAWSQRRGEFLWRRMSLSNI